MDASGKVGITPWLIVTLPVIEQAHLPEVGAELRVAEPFGALEGSKGVLDLYAPCSGRVLEVNEIADPEVLRRSPFDDGWLLRVDGAPHGLLDAESYARGAVRRQPHR
jgi:glycine cleavage system H protein